MKLAIKSSKQMLRVAFGGGLAFGMVLFAVTNRSASTMNMVHNFHNWHATSEASLLAAPILINPKIKK
jgi:hypothetical protein